MRFILSQYLRTLKERDEFDRLLPDILLAMGYVPISRPQAGIRQYGVDFAAVGKSPKDGVQELLLCVIKQGDIGRSNWDSGPQAVRQSLDEIFDVYLKTHVEPGHKLLRKKVVLATTGDLKQDSQINWDGYSDRHSSLANFEFWGADQTALHIEKYLLNEQIFGPEDRADTRKALALSGDLDYDHRDLHRLLLRQLGLLENGELLADLTRTRDLVKGLRAVSLSAQIFSRWSENEGNLKHALIASERVMLWAWHRIQLEKPEDWRKYSKDYDELWRCYLAVAHRYLEKMKPHFLVEDGLSGYCRENTEFSLVVFEHIGLVASIGLSHLMVTSDEETAQNYAGKAGECADALVSLLKNNPVSGSPRFDGNVTDIVLGFLLLVFTNHFPEARDWLSELSVRLDYTLKLKRNFPICTDSHEDLVELVVFDNEEERSRLMETSWLLPTLAGWAVILKCFDLYQMLARSTKTEYPEVCLQLWHPTASDTSKFLYFSQAQFDCGESEAPIILPDKPVALIDQMKTLLQSERHNVISSSTAGRAGRVAIDLIGCRHFRTPVAPFFWYQILELANPDQFMKKGSSLKRVGKLP